MGKKEQLEELDRQLAEAKKKLRIAGVGVISGILFIFIFWPIALIIFAMVIGYYLVYGKRINEINLEKAKLK